MKDITVVLWDEATMSDRRIVEAVDELFGDIHPELRQEGVHFPGVTCIFGGDWRQTLPIIKDLHPEGIYAYTLKSSVYWNNIQVK